MQYTDTALISNYTSFYNKSLRVLAFGMYEPFHIRCAFLLRSTFTPMFVVLCWVCIEWRHVMPSSAGCQPKTFILVLQMIINERTSINEFEHENR